MENTLEFVHGLQISTTELLHFRQYNLTAPSGGCSKSMGYPFLGVKKR